MRMIAAFSAVFKGCGGGVECASDCNYILEMGATVAVVTGAAVQRPLATVHCSQSYCLPDRLVFFVFHELWQGRGRIERDGRADVGLPRQAGLHRLVVREHRGKVQRWRIFLWCARRTQPQVEPCWGGCCLFTHGFCNRMGCMVAVWPVSALNRGAAL